MLEYMSYEHLSGPEGNKNKSSLSQMFLKKRTPQSKQNGPFGIFDQELVEYGCITGKIY